MNKLDFSQRQRQSKKSSTSNYSNDQDHLQPVDTVPSKIVCMFETSHVSTKIQAFYLIQNGIEQHRVEKNNIKFSKFLAKILNIHFACFTLAPLNKIYINYFITNKNCFSFKFHPSILFNHPQTEIIHSKLKVVNIVIGLELRCTAKYSIFHLIN